MHRTGLSDLRSHLSNERRHLSYIRTCISMPGLGITINRFSVFMQEKEKLVADGSAPLLRSSEYARAGMVMALTAVLLAGGGATVAWLFLLHWPPPRGQAPWVPLAP